MIGKWKGIEKEKSQNLQKNKNLHISKSNKANGLMWLWQFVLFYFRAFLSSNFNKSNWIGCIDLLSIAVNCRSLHTFNLSMEKKWLLCNFINWNNRSTNYSKDYWFIVVLVHVDFFQSLFCVHVCVCLRRRCQCTIIYSFCSSQCE